MQHKWYNKFRFLETPDLGGSIKELWLLTRDKKFAVWKIGIA